MSMAEVPPCPPPLKAIQHYLKVAQEHESRDPVVCYWSLLYALQTGLNIDRKSDVSRAFIVKVMDILETMKQGLKDNESITNEVAAQAHIENYALKLFTWADSQDRASNFGKNVVKAFYTAGMLFDVLTTFGELPEDILQNRKYAKWKAAYIHNCLKNGETPVPGPMQGEEEGIEGGEGTVDDGNNEANQITPASPPAAPAKQGSTESNDIIDDFGLPQVPPSMPNLPPASTPGDGPPFVPQGQFPSPGFSGFNLPSTPSQPTIPAPTPAPQPAPVFPSPSAQPVIPAGPAGGVTLTPEQMTKAQKYCKWAGSALNYDDAPTAIMNLEKALILLKTGVDS